MRRIFFIVFLSLVADTGFSQYKWKQEKDKNGIKVFTSAVNNSDFKAIKVECTLKGSYPKLIAVLTNVTQFSNWIFNTKSSRLVSRTNPLDFVYYSEIRMPIPFSNRDVVINLQIKTDNLPNYLFITGKSKSGLVPEVPGKVRVNHYMANWKVSMPAANTIHISYIVEMDPGGNIPAWVANMFSGKGPFETFSKLAKLLME